MATAELNARLLEAYNRGWDRFAELRSSTPGMSLPQLMCVPEGFTRAHTRMMIVGQEGYGWEVDAGSKVPSVEELMELYKHFNLGERWRGTPFWQAAWTLDELLNPPESRGNFLWSNLYKCDVAKDRPSRSVGMELRSLEWLQQEIQITKPDVVVFFTGPAYDDEVEAQWPEVRFQELWATVHRVVHQSLPTRTVRTYHPKYLRLKKLWDDTLPRLAQQLSNPAEA